MDEAGSNGSSKKILIAIDGSPGSVRAAETAKRLFPHATFMAINVATTPHAWSDRFAFGDVGPWPYPAAGGRAHDESDTEEHATSVAESIAHDAGIDEVESLSGTGDTAKIIIDAAHAHLADLLVVGWTDKGWLARLLAGSVASDVIRHADVPVLVAK